MRRIHFSFHAIVLIVAADVGCLTCKAKRKKCDEAKPSCGQCVFRGIQCGGYRQDLKWKAFGQPKGKSSSTRPEGNRSGNERANDSPALGSDLLTEGLSGIVDNAIGIPEVLSPEPAGWLPNSSSVVADTDLQLPGCGEEFTCEEQSPRSVLSLPFLVNEHDTDAQYQFEWQSCGSDTLDLFSTWPIRPLSPTQNENQAEQQSPASDTQAVLSPHPNPAHAEDLFAFFQQPNFQSGSPEMISVVFHRYLCDILSIDHKPQLNPWRVHVWPLAKDCPALYNAIAAMTCFYLSRAQPQLRIQGIEHVQYSMEGLATNVESGTMSLDAALAASLALAWAESWDPQTSTNGKNHIKGARLLVEQLRATSPMTDCIEFLENAFTYMNVLARITSTFDDLSITKPIPRIPDHSTQGEVRFDTLMGFASTLFPVIGAVADLVGYIRMRHSRNNSPAIISRAIELKKAITKWTPSVDLEIVDDPSSIMSDSVQTAEAYRWATLLLLQQAVPELPTLNSLGQLAQRVLIFLATIPLTSRTLIIQMFPLMMAGCEVLEEEDRDWVRQRWISMSKRMVTGLVENCLQVTLEVWRRRDEYALKHGLCRDTGAKLTLEFNFPIDPSLEPDVPNSTSAGNTPTGSRHQQGPHSISHSTSLGFPISAAFKKGVDYLTRSGNTEFAPKGRMHWLGVMRDWDWEVLLG